MTFHVYVSNSGSEHLSHFVMSVEDGRLESQSDIELPGAPGAVATDAAQRFLYVALRSQMTLASYRIDGGSGALTPISTSQLEEGPPYIETDNTDRFLLASYYGGGRVSVHELSEEGVISEQPIQVLETEIRAHSIQTDRSNRFAFVPHTNPTNAIYQFRFDERSGQLVANDPPKIQPVTPEGPRHFVFHPKRDVLYSVNEDGCTVSTHLFDAAAGTLESIQVISTLPDGFEVEGNSTAEIKITQDGCHLYASNRGPNSLAHFAVGNDGMLSAVGHYPTEATPRFFELDPSGRYVYSVGQDSGHMQSYEINDSSGVLEPLERHTVGESPLWIQFVKKE